MNGQIKMETQSSNNRILRNFYQQTLSLYTPREESFLDTASSQVFDRLSFRYTFTVEAMTKVSYIIEDAALANPRVTTLHVSFQYLSRLLPQQARYRRLADVVKGLWLYGVPDVPESKFPALPRAAIVNTTDTILVNYWFVVAYGPGIGMALLAEEIPPLEDSDRYYEGFYTFDLDIAYQIIAILNRIYPDKIPRPVRPEQLSEL